MANERPNAAKRVNPRIKKLTNQNLELVAANKKLREDRDSLLTKFNEKRDERGKLVTQKSELNEKNKRLAETNQKLTEQNNELIKSNKTLREDRDSILAMFNEKRAEADKIQKQNEILQAESGAQAAVKVDEAALEQERERFRAELAKKDEVIVMMRDEAERARAEVKSYAGSTSWKITAPVRSVLNIFKRS